MRSTFYNFIDYIDICTSYKNEKNPERFKILRTNFNEQIFQKVLKKLSFFTERTFFKQQTFLKTLVFFNKLTIFPTDF